MYELYSIEIFFSHKPFKTYRHAEWAHGIQFQNKCTFIKLTMSLVVRTRCVLIFFVLFIITLLNVVDKLLILFCINTIFFFLFQMFIYVHINCFKPSERLFTNNIVGTDDCVSDVRKMFKPLPFYGTLATV